MRFYTIHKLNKPIRRHAASRRNLILLHNRIELATHAPAPGNHCLAHYLTTFS